MFIEIMGKYIPPLEAVMADDVPGETKAILDLGCGSGSWFVDGAGNASCVSADCAIARIMEAAHDFPNCNAVAVDLVPMQSPYVVAFCAPRSAADHIAVSYMPPNCR